MPSNNPKTRVNENGRQIQRSFRDRPKVIEIAKKVTPHRNARTIQIPVNRQKIAYMMRRGVYPVEIGNEFEIPAREAFRIAIDELFGPQKEAA